MVAVEAGADALGFNFVEKYAALRDAGAGGAHRARAPARSSRRSASSGIIRPATSRQAVEACGLRRAAVPRRRDAGGSRRGYTLPVIKTIKLPPAKVLAGFPEAHRRRRPGGRVRQCVAAILLDSAERWSEGEVAPSDRVAPGPSAARRPLPPDPLGRPHAGQRGRRGRDGGAVRGRRGLRASRPRPAGRITTRCAASSAEAKRAVCRCEPRAARRPGPLRPLRRALRPRDADGAADRARASLRGGPARPEASSAGSHEPAGRLRGPAHAALLRRAADRALRRRARSSSSARTSVTPARTRSTTCSARRCSPSRWASIA